MKLAFTDERHLRFETPLGSVGYILPVINGAWCEDWRIQIVQNDARRVELRFTGGLREPGAFVLEVLLDESQYAWLRYWVEDYSDELALDSFGIHFVQVENLRAYLRNGYYSWDGSYYVQPEAMAGFEEYEQRPETGYAMTQILPRNGVGSLVMGFDRHDRFQHIFRFHTQQQPPGLTVETLWDRKSVESGQPCVSERLVIFWHPEVENALRAWARRVAATASTPPRVDGPAIAGWCSWYNLYGYISEENILEHLQGAVDIVQRDNLPMRVFQIDDGFTPEMGDWLEVKPQFPGGIKPLLDEIRAARFIPGLWIAPFMVGNRSRLFREHPDWVVKDRATGEPLVHWRLYGEFRWHKRSEEYYILDTTHPEAFEYLRHVFHVWRHDWGCEYFKTDFMHFGSEYGPDQALWHTPGLTRIEIWRRCAEMIRTEIGEATWLGCGCPLWASVGLVDAVRIGRDVGVTWSGGLSAQSLLRDQSTRNFGNHILWQIDPDCILLRERYSHLSDSEVESLAIFAGMSGGVIMTSDHLGELSAERLRLWRLILPAGRNGCDFPLLGRSEVFYARLPDDLDPHRIRHLPYAADPMLVQVRRISESSGYGALFILNPGDQTIQRSYPLSELGFEGPHYLWEWGDPVGIQHPVEKITLTLAAHASRLYFISRQLMKAAPEILPA